MDLDLHVTKFTWAGSPDRIAPGLCDIARKAEAIGVRALSLMDHYFQIEVAGAPEDPMLEGYTALGFLAGVTSSLRLRLLVTGVTYRHPGLLAKIVTTLDVLSRGRAELGIGAAWYEREHLGLGVPFPPLAERFERLEEAVQICLQMWSADNGPFAGRHYRLAETLCVPAPVSRPRPRIMIGGSGEKKTLRLVAQYADACNVFGDATVLAHKIEVLRRHCDAVGRNIGEIEITAFVHPQVGWSAGDVVRGAEELADLGVATVMVSADGDSPVEWLEGLIAPAMPDITAIEPRAL
jgi:F420-dependent oxidoreductase-like protein